VISAPLGNDIFEEKCTLCHELPQPQDMKAARGKDRIDEKIAYLKLTIEQGVLLRQYLKILAEE